MSGRSQTDARAVFALVPSSSAMPSLLRCAALCILVLCLAAQLAESLSPALIDVTSTRIAVPRPPTPPGRHRLKNSNNNTTGGSDRISLRRNGSVSQDLQRETDASCVPEVEGWDLVRGAALRNVGYHAAAIPIGRYVLVMGGASNLGAAAVDVYNYTVHHTQRGMNLFDPVEGVVSMVEEVVPNASSVRCPPSPANRDFAASFALEDRNEREGRSNSEKKKRSAMMVAPDKASSQAQKEMTSSRRCIEAQQENSTVVAQLPVPVVGSGSVVRVRNRVFVFGACNTIPAGVHLDALLRSAPSNADNNATSPSSVRVVEDYLRSVLRIQFYQRGSTKATRPVVHQTLLKQSSNMILRYNATCVVGARDIVYMIGGVNARTGEALTSVAQFHTESETFVEGVWSLDEPVITPAAASDSGLLFLAGGYSTRSDPSFFDPMRQRRDLHTKLAVLDTQRGVLDRQVARYAADSAAELQQWTAPQMFVRGSGIFMIGSGGRKPYCGVAYWLNMSAAPAAYATLKLNREVNENATSTREAPVEVDVGTQPATSGGSRNHSSTVALTGTQKSGLFQFADFSLVPARRDAVVVMLPSAEEGTAVVFYLFGGRAPAMTTSDSGDVAEREIFKATMHLSCVEGKESAKTTEQRSVATQSEFYEVGQATQTPSSVAVVAGAAAAAPALPTLLGFSYTRFMGSAHHSAGSQALGPLPSNSSVSPIAGIVASAATMDNNDGHRCVPVSGYLPVWYNISFSVLLSYKETVQSCPGILPQTPHSPSHSNASAVPHSSCAVMLSTSPRCDEPVVEFKHLSPLNVREVRVPVSRNDNDNDNDESARGSQAALAVGQTLLMGSMDEGLVHALAAGEDGRTEPAGRNFTYVSRRTHEQEEEGAAVRRATLFYEQTFLYVCFSRRQSVIAHCGLTQPRYNAAFTNTSVEDTPSDYSHRPQEVHDATLEMHVAAREVVCSTRFYETLSPSLPLLLSPEHNCSHADAESADDDSPTDAPEPPPSPTPSPSHLLRPWMMLTILIVLIVALVSYMLVSLVLMPGYAFSRRRQQDRLSAAGAADQQRSLLPYREARIYLGAGGIGLGAAGGVVGGAGGPGGADGLAEEDLPDEYETALMAAGVNAGLTGFEAGWGDATEAGPRRRRLLDGKYEVIKKLGKGSFSVVYLVRRITDNATFALKYLQCSDDVDRHEAMKECEVVYALQGHPNVIQLFDMFMSYRFDRHMVTVPRSRKTRNAAVAAAAAAGGGRKHRRKEAEEVEVGGAAGARRRSDGTPGGTPTTTTTSGTAEDSARNHRVGDEGLRQAGATAEIAGAEVNPVRSRGSSRRVLIPREDTAEGGQAKVSLQLYEALAAAGPSGNAEPTTPADSNEPQQQNHDLRAMASPDKAGVEVSNGKLNAAVVGGVPADTYSSSAVLDAREARPHNGNDNNTGNDNSQSNREGATSEQQSMLTASSSNTTSAATSTTSRAIVHMDSAYLDAMTAGMLRDDSLESPTTPSHQPQQPQQQTTSNKNKEGASDGQDPQQQQQQQQHHHHQRGLSSLQAERYLSLVMAYHERGDLARWVRHRRALQPLIPEATVVSIAFQVLSLLSYMHHRHQPPIIHRDLKPENILLTTHVHYENVNEDFLPIVVTDFGLSRVMDKTFCETGVGSLPYVAPECWQRRYSTKVDIWALGCVLYAVCSKRVDSSNVKVMFSECMQDDFHTRLRHEIEHIYGYSDALAWFITVLLAVKPDDRPTASEALRMLRHRPTNADGQPLFATPPLAALLRASPSTPAEESPATRPKNSQDDSAHANDKHKDGGGAAQQQQEQQVGHRERPTPLPTSYFSARQTSQLSMTTPSTSEASASPMEVLRTPEISDTATGAAAAPPANSPITETTAGAAADKWEQRSTETAGVENTRTRNIWDRATAAAAAAAAAQTQLPGGVDDVDDDGRESRGERAGDEAVVLSSSLSGPPSTRVASTMPPHSAQRVPRQSSAFHSDDEQGEEHEDEEEEEEREAHNGVAALPSEQHRDVQQVGEEVEENSVARVLVVVGEESQDDHPDLVAVPSVASTAPPNLVPSNVTDAENEV